MVSGKLCLAVEDLITWASRAARGGRIGQQKLFLAAFTPNDLHKFTKLNKCVTLWMSLQDFTMDEQQGLDPNYGFTSVRAERWNGRFAMMGLLIGLLTEVLTGQGILHQLGLL